MTDRTKEEGQSPSLFDLAGTVDEQLADDGVLQEDSGYRELTHADAFAMAYEACTVAAQEPGLHRLCAPHAPTRRLFCQCVTAALKNLNTPVTRFEAGEDSSFAWLLPNYSLILVVAEDPDQAPDHAQA